MRTTRVISDQTL